MSTRSHRGSDLRALLKDEGMLEEVEALTLKRALAIQIEKLVREQSLSITEMAARMKTSRAAVDRILDALNPSITLATLGKAARVLGRKAQDRAGAGVGLWSRCRRSFRAP